MEDGRGFLSKALCFSILFTSRLAELKRKKKSIGGAMVEYIPEAFKIFGR
jgi:hypothetical protein